MKYHIRRVYNHISRRYAVRISNPAAVRDENHRDGYGCIVNAAKYLDPTEPPFGNPRMAEAVAAEINRHYPDAGAYSAEVRNYELYGPSLETLWRRGDAAII